jgi:type II secretory pathway pseudopilin PulG
MVKYRAGSRAAFTVVELLVVVAAFFLMIAALTPFVKMAKARSDRNRCVNNLREISLGLHAYAADHGDMFPAKLGELYPSYLANEKAFDCPESKTIGTKDSPDYVYTAGLKEYSPAKTTIVCDSAGNHGRSGKNIVRIDGSIELVAL